MAKFEAVSDRQFEQIEAQTRNNPLRVLCAVRANFLPAENAVEIQLNNGLVARIPVALVPGLGDASLQDLMGLRLEGDGYGLHVPAIDADISIPSLFSELLGSHAMSQAVARRAASRANGRLGGRPRKAVG